MENVNLREKVCTVWFVKKIRFQEKDLAMILNNTLHKNKFLHFQIKIIYYLYCIYMYYQLKQKTELLSPDGASDGGGADDEELPAGKTS